MATPSINVEIVHSFENLAMTPEQIAEDQELELDVVKSILLASSVEYRAMTTQKDSNELFSKDDLRSAIGVMKTSLLEDDPHLRLRAAKFIIDEIKGRNDARVQIPIDQSFNALEFNKVLLAARSALLRGREQKTIERTEKKNSLTHTGQAVRIIDVEPITA